MTHEGNRYKCFICIVLKRYHYICKFYRKLSGEKHYVTHTMIFTSACHNFVTYCTKSRGLIGEGPLLAKVILLNWGEIKHKSTFLEKLQWHNKTRQMLSPLLIFPYVKFILNAKLSAMPLFFSLAMCKAFNMKKHWGFILGWYIFLFYFLFIILMNLVLTDHF